MNHRRFVVGAVITLALTSATSASAALRKHHVSQMVRLVTVTQSRNYPSPGSSATDAGLVSGTVGSGAVSQTTRITGHPNATTFAFRTTSTAFYAHGSITSSITGTATLQRDGSVKLAGHGRYIAGTDVYRGARGTFTLKGTIPPANPNKPTPAIVHVSGNVSY